MKKIMNVTDLENIAGRGIKEAKAYLDELLRKYGVTSAVELNYYATEEERDHLLWLYKIKKHSFEEQSRL